MKLKLIETPDYILAVSDEEIKEGEAFIDLRNQELDSEDIYWAGLGGDVKFANIIGKKIIAHQPKGDAKELDLPLLPQIVIEDDGEKLMYDAIQKARGNDFQTFYKLAAKNCYEVHNAATKEYSEEDIRRIAQFAFSFHRRNDLDDNELEIEFNRLLDKNIQSLKQPKTPKWFVAETIRLNCYDDCMTKECQEHCDKTLKTTTTNGKTYLVGTYLYE